MFINAAPDPLLDLDPWVGQRQCTFRFDVQDAVAKQVIGEIHPLRGANLTHDTGKTIKRTLNMGLGRADTAAINPLTDRILPYMVFPNGAEYQLGKYLFTSESRDQFTSGDLGTYSLNDEMFILDQQIRQGINGASGTISSVVLRILDEFDVEHNIEPSNFVTNEAWTIGTYRGKVLDALAVTGDYFCMVPETKVLCADLVWRPLGDLRIGDEIIGFDEAVNARSQRYRRAVVESANRRKLECFAFKTEFGTTTASADHLWLVKRSAPTKDGHRREWKKTKDLVAGDEILAFGEPWEADESREAGYLAGVYDGEGCLALPKGGGKYPPKVPRITFGQNPGVVLETVKNLLASKGFDFRCKSPGARKLELITHKGGKYEAMRFLGSIRPQRLLAASSPLWEDRATWSISPNHKNKVQVISIEPVGVHEVVAIGTSTKTLIADGMLTHNSPWFDNSGVFRMIRTYNPVDRIPDLNLDQGNRVLRNSIVETSDLLTAPNVIMVISNTPSAVVTTTTSGSLVGNVGNLNAQVIGVSRIPASAPNSIANRGFEIPDVRTMQLASPGQAQAVAEGLAQRLTVFERVTLTTPPDPRHDSYNVIVWNGDVWLELSWSMALVEGGAMNHLLRKAYRP